MMPSNKNCSTTLADDVISGEGLVIWKCLQCNLIHAGVLVGDEVVAAVSMEDDEAAKISADLFELSGIHTPTGVPLQ